MKRLPVLLALLCVVLACGSPGRPVPPAARRDGTSPILVSAEIQAELMRFADRYAIAVAQAADELRERAATPEARIAAQSWKIQQATVAWLTASNENPMLNAADMAVLVSIARMVQEDDWTERFGEHAARLVELHRQLEREVWQLLARVLSPEQREELRALIAEWRAENPHQRYVARIGLRDFAAAAGAAPSSSPSRSVRPGSLFSLLMVDPLAGLDPAAREVERTRYTAERAIYYFQRMPTLVSWQAELVAFQLVTTREATQLFANAERLTSTAEGLPAVVDAQRRAAIDQVFDRLAGEADALGGTLVELRQALEAGTAMASSVDGALGSADALMARFPQQPAAAAAPDARPFDIRDYAATATEVGAALRELQLALASLDQATPQIERAGATLEAAGTRLIGRAFLAAAGAIGLLLVGALATALIYHRLSAGSRARSEALR